MPKQPMNYQNNIIYKIQHETIDELIYVGSTCNFVKRKCSHKTTCYNEKQKGYNYKLYKTIRENGGWDSFNMTMVSKYPCADNLEAIKEEERIRRELNATMNAKRCFRSDEVEKECRYIDDKKYREGHSEKYKENKKKYYQEHSEKLNEKIECECGCIVSTRGMNTHKQTDKHKRLILEKLI